MCAAFLTAAGYASANVLYNIGDPAFVHEGYTIAPIAVRLAVYSVCAWRLLMMTVDHTAHGHCERHACGEYDGGKERADVCWAVRDGECLSCPGDEREKLMMGVSRSR